MTHDRARQIGAAVLCFGIFALGSIWNVIYIQPHEAFYNAVMECTDGHRDRMTYKLCVVSLRAEQEADETTE